MLGPLHKRVEDATLALNLGRSAYEVGDYELAVDLFGRCEREARQAQLIALDVAGLTRGRR